MLRASSTFYSIVWYLILLREMYLLISTLQWLSINPGSRLGIEMCYSILSGTMHFIYVLVAALFCLYPRCCYLRTVEFALLVITRHRLPGYRYAHGWSLLERVRCCSPAGDTLFFLLFIWYLGCSFVLPVLSWWSMLGRSFCSLHLGYRCYYTLMPPVAFLFTCVSWYHWVPVSCLCSPVILPVSLHSYEFRSDVLCLMFCSFYIYFRRIVHISCGACSQAHSAL